MVGVPKSITDLMHPSDWAMFSVKSFDGQLPMRRLQIPMPPSGDRIFTLVNEMGGFAERVRLSTQDAGTTRQALLDFEFLISQQNTMWQRTRERWERELRDGTDEQLGMGGTLEQIRVIK